MVISPQMIADVTKKAESFRNYGFSNEEKTMCPTLGRMNDKDIKNNTYEVRDFFMRLYIWNYFSYGNRYNEEIQTKNELSQEFENCLRRANEIDIYQFVEILSFLHYNIENYEFDESFEDKTQMDADVELIRKMQDEICKKIVEAVQKEKGSRWYY